MKEVSNVYSRRDRTSKTYSAPILQDLPGIFYARVEDRQDPQQRGRVKVRILDIHSFEGNQVPINSLPWAEPLLSLSMSSVGSINPPKPNSWVLVSLIGNDPNYPIYIGQANGLRVNWGNDSRVASEGTLRQIIEREYSTFSKEDRNNLFLQIARTQFLEGGDCGGTEEYCLSVSNLVRGKIKNSPISTSDQNKSHVCNVSYGIRLRILQGSQAVRNAIEWLRKGIKSLMSGFKKSAFGQWIESGLKHINSLLKKIRRFLKFVNDTLLEIAKIIRDIQTLIAWILSLPAQLLVYLRNCLDQFLSDISSAISEGWGSVTDTNGEKIDFSTIRETVNLTVGIIQDSQKASSTFRTLDQQIKSIPDTFSKV